jgi:hypothetical protein
MVFPDSVSVVVAQGVELFDEPPRSYLSPWLWQLWKHTRSLCNLTSHAIIRVMLDMKAWRSEAYSTIIYLFNQLYDLP